MEQVMKIIEIEQGDDLWHVERHGCVTGTKIESAIGACFSVAKQQWQMGGKTWEFEGSKLVCVAEGKKTKASKSKQKTLSLEIVSDLQSEVEIDDYCSETMERGNDLEPLSVKAASNKHKIEFIECGMLQSDTLERFKFSPDAIALDKNNVVVGGYETKSKAGSKHIEYMINGTVPHEHLLQCLCPMIMDDCVKWWIFGHYDDRNHINNLFTTGIKRTDYEDFIQVARVELIEFFEEINKTVEKMGGIYHG
jgi:hypothetical protein